ncbi:hypothetical protein CROQUDRAFT_671039 [Cronartium quercuum f. sp. fusiforme G11]|uniref:Uncharacterized protein n=1 Tax=Cronartium quercuum f. sp. fusiforme G11 TaxID=708437 RepID=A0A9P6NNC9_9BASI|nr:hypothetical protein CROQUDRAFT_671039 [Cronartium quercuum f. sp. fusiforme G11]
MSEIPTRVIQPFDLLGSAPDSEVTKAFLDNLYTSVKQNTESLTSSELVPIVKIYPDKTVYHSYPDLGIDLEFRPDYTNQLQLISIDIENHERNEDELIQSEANQPIEFLKSRRRNIKKPPSPYSGYPILIEIKSETSAQLPQPKLILTPKTTGKEFLESLGEPTRKGGPDVLRSGSGIWLEWTWSSVKTIKYGLFVQWRGAASVGPGKWEKGGDRKWGTLKMFLDP